MFIIFQQRFIVSSLYKKGSFYLKSDKIKTEKRGICMKRITMTILVLIFIFLSGCSSQSIKAGRYVMENTETEDWSWIDIKEGNTYEFNRANNVSYRPSGKYTVENNKLILNVGDNSYYTFLIDGDSLIYESTTTSGHFIKKGTVYTLKNK
jgi:hypothetical protein